MFVNDKSKSCWYKCLVYLYNTIFNIFNISIKPKKLGAYAPCLGNKWGDVHNMTICNKKEKNLNQNSKCY